MAYVIWKVFMKKYSRIRLGLTGALVSLFKFLKLFMSISKLQHDSCIWSSAIHYYMNAFLHPICENLQRQVFSLRGMDDSNWLFDIITGKICNTLGEVAILNKIHHQLLMLLWTNFLNISYKNFVINGYQKTHNTLLYTKSPFRHHYSDVELANEHCESSVTYLIVVYQNAIIRIVWVFIKFVLKIKNLKN